LAVCTFKKHTHECSTAQLWVMWVKNVYLSKITNLINRLIFRSTCS